MQKSRFGPFALEGQLGKLGEGSVYRAIHLGQKRMVAVKMFSAPLASTNPAAKQTLVAEIEALKKLRHWNVVRCYGGILEEMEGCLAYELVEGESLAELLERRGRLAWETVVDYAYQIASGLECAHEQGVVHGDLQPDKILIAEDGTLKISDFRVKRSQNPWCASSSRASSDHDFYRSPEQLGGPSEPSHKADLYSLGCIIYQMLVGSPPLTGDSAEEIAKQHAEVVPPRVDSVVFDCPVWLSGLVRELLEKDPRKRPYGASAVLLALSETTRQVAAKTTVVEHAAGGFSALTPQVHKDEARVLLEKAGRKSEEPDEQVKEQPPFYERAWFLASCLCLLLGGIAGWLLWPESESRLLKRAVAIIETREGIQRENARPLLERMLRKFPDGEHADEAQEHLEELNIESAARKFAFNVKYSREPKSEAERLFKDAWDFEQFGDRMTALEKYRSMADLLADSEDEDQTSVAFVNLARRQVTLIEQQGSDEDRLRFVEDRLDRADQLSASGKEIEAQKLWRGVIELYGNKPEFDSFVQRAEAALHAKRANVVERPST